MLLDMIKRSCLHVQPLAAMQRGEGADLLNFILELSYAVHMGQFLQHCAMRAGKADGKKAVSSRDVCASVAVK